MSCTNPNCECKPGTFANLNPPTKAKPLQYVPRYRGQEQFTAEMLPALEWEWQHKVSLRTTSGKYRVEITWSLDKYSVYVWRRVQEPEKVVRYHYAFTMRNAVKTANKMLRWYERNGH